MTAERNKKRIWIDLDNSPHVPFFKPIISRLKHKNYDLVITQRDCFQVKGLTKLHGINCKTIGRHYGKSKIAKVVGLIIRTVELLPTIFSSRPHLALSHGSRAQILAARMFGIPTVVIADYEYTKKILNPDRIIVPEVIPDHLFGLPRGSVLKYPGIKEDVYAPDLRPDSRILVHLNLDPNRVIVTVRPPATEAHYHNPESEILFDMVMDYLGEVTNVCAVILPRTQRQGHEILSKWNGLAKDGKLMIPRKVVNGLNLIWHSDLVVSGGGTMNREAAALGVPVYSIFRGKIGAVDRYLAQEGRLALIEKQADIRTKMVLRKRQMADISNAPRGALDTIIAHLVEFLERPLTRQ